MRKYGRVWHTQSGEPINDGYTEEELRELIDAWRTNADSIGADLYDLTGDLAIGPKIVEDLLERIKELEGKSVP